jgi:hypothetical protein
MDKGKNSNMGGEESVTQQRDSSASPKKFMLPIKAVVMALVVTALGVIIVNRYASPTAFVIGNKKYAKSSIQAMAGYASHQNGSTVSQEAKTIFAMYEQKAAAQNVGIVPNSDELKATQQVFGITNTSPPGAKEYMQLVIFNQALPRAYERYKSGSYSGVYFMFDFSTFIHPAPVGEIPLPKYGDQKEIAKDNKYALEVANTAYENYKKNSSDLTVLAKSITGDKTVGFVGTVVSFSPENGALVTQVPVSGIYNYITAQTKAGLSSIRTGQVATTHTPRPHDYADGYYYFVDLKAAGKIINDPAGLIKQAISKLKVKYYGL